MSKLKAKSPEEAKPSKPKIAIYAKAGCGKTWFSLDFPNVYYIDTEGGANLPHYTRKLKASNGVYMGVEDGAADFKEVIEQVKALATEKHPYKTLVIDSITNIFNISVADEQEALGDKDAFGASKKPAVAHMRQLIKWINRLDMNVILICHEKSEWGMVTNANGKKERQEVGTTFDGWDKLEYELHVVFRIVKNGTERIMQVPRKSRLEQFPEGKSFKCDFETFANIYGKDVIYSDVATEELASPEQVTELKKLISLYKIDQATQQKWLEKALSTDFEDMPQTKIQKLIEHLKKQGE